MRINRLEVENFKAIRKLVLDELSDSIVIAGPNGCGKSCIFDSIRLLKSVYTGYNQHNEWNSFFNEFQLNLQNPDEIKRLFNNKLQKIKIEAEFQLNQKEKKYLSENIDALLNKLVWKGQFDGRRTQQRIVPTATQNILNPEFEESLTKLKSSINNLLKSDTQKASLIISPNLELDVHENSILEIIFSLNDPQNIGMIDYHSPNRAYNRERIGGINIDIEESSNRFAQHALYNWQNKYSNVKSEMAAAFVRDLLAAQAKGETYKSTSIIKTITELFSTFLPGKSFGGPQPGVQGELSFPVFLEDGGQHDIDDLSSGEKELVYGYLRIRNVSPENSIILLDEPELHLNPRIINGLPNFYKKHLGTELNNQVWMVTHSDAFLRDAYKTSNFSIFHMTPALKVASGENQAIPISATSEVDRAVIDLVGDIAGYRPGSKVVIFESSESASFDAQVTGKLFPEFILSVNAISGDNKTGVKHLYAALEKAVRQMSLPIKVYAITDLDSESPKGPNPNARAFTWDVYHIENYLLESAFIKKVMDDTPTFAKKMTIAQIEKELINCAKDTQPVLFRHKMSQFIYGEIMSSLDLGFSPRAKNVETEINNTIRRVKDKIIEKCETRLSPEEIKSKGKEINDGLHSALKSGSWKSEFRGRDILKLFAGKFISGIPYEAFRDAIVARMNDAGFQPPGMKHVIDQILSD